jgi:hypothetical protein
MIMVGSVFVVLMVWDRIAGLHTLSSRQGLQSVLDQPGVKGLGLTVTDLEAAVKLVSMIGAACATAMVVLGWQALQRSRTARVALSILAVPLFLCGLVTGGFVSAAVAAAVATLWWGPARQWFDGHWTPRPAGSGSKADPTQPRPSPWPDRPTPSPPPSAAWPPPPTSPYDVRYAVHPRVRGPRPTPVLWACLVTWFFSGLAVLLMGATSIVLAADSQMVLDRMHEQNPQLSQQGISDHTILVVCFLACAAFALWSLAAAVVAAFAFRGTAWAWYALLISTGGALLFCLVGSIGSLLMLVPLAATGATLYLLLRPETRAWFVRR